ncbi:MAG TPA: peptidase M23, partial [Arthrobacter sp.]|nr:peptidase M23 [Arthrobacter sp.]
MNRTSRVPGRAGVHQRRRTGIISGLLALVLAASLGASTPPAFADELEDKQAALEAEAARVQQSLEFVDSRIAKAAGDLVIYQGQLPGAQQALLEAQGRVASAVKEVEALAARVDLAQQNKAKITQQLETDKQKIADTKKLIGQIATQAYKSGGVPSNLTLFFGSNAGGSLTDTMDLADQAMRSQNSAMDKLTQQNATNVNSQARLQAVEAEIQDLKAKADAALEREKAARDEAAAKKAQVDQLIADTTRLDAELQAARPGIQSQLAAVEASQNAVANEIAERDRRLREAWEAEQR